MSSSPRTARPWLPLALLLILVLAGGLLLWAPGPGGNTPATGGDFTVQTQQGPLRLGDWRGKVVLLYFGYTHCPDICPTTLASEAEALGRLNGEELAQVRSLMISVDPERDPPAHLAEYTRFFHPSIQGATASPEEIAAIARRYGVIYHRQEVNSAGGYVVDHSATLFVIDRQGKLVDQLPHGTPPEVLVDKIRALLRTPASTP